MKPLFCPFESVFCFLFSLVFSFLKCFSVFLCSGSRTWQNEDQMLLHKPSTIMSQLSFCRRGYGKTWPKMISNEKRFSAMACDKRVAKPHERNGETSFLPSALSFLSCMGELNDHCWSNGSGWRSMEKAWKRHYQAHCHHRQSHQTALLLKLETVEWR